MHPFPSYTKEWHSSSYPSISPTRPELSLSGKTIVIAGGGAGIGLAISKSLAQAGVSKLAIIGRRAAVLSDAATSIHDLVGDKTQVLTIAADISEKMQIDEAFAEIGKNFGAIDILIPNAAYFTGVRPFGEESVEDWEKNLNVNVKGMYLVASAFLKHAAKNASIINISTAMIHLPPFGGFSSYSATKLAGTNIMDSIQKEHPNVHIVNVHPGRVRETEMAGRAVGPDHIDDADLAGDFVVWLASEEAKFLNGKFVWVNWDVDELKAKAKEIQDSALLSIGLVGFSDFKY
ncbi:NAD(P)-binding protein [Mollisia scopiformis]|uniref:NAD(P)-binding protein n=1 Tax=Mollisia scopiformis TaxID=149040 RepID=A0A132B841_MOLSC|nr:NAD(P)-binding protein [Mollisia scopiformis]KUJ08159.1 NAD(P)-binding protein [Mollisia scopiformis]